MDMKPYSASDLVLYFEFEDTAEEAVEETAAEETEETATEE